MNYLDPEQDYLSDGMTEEMIAQLGRLHPETLRAIAKTSVMQYQKTKTPIDQIGRAWVWFVRNQLGLAAHEEAGPKAKTAALRAIELDENLAGAHEVLAMARWLNDWDWDGALEAFRRAIELNPNVATAQAMYAHLLLIVGHGEEALAHSRRSTELDPFNPLVHGWYAQLLYMQRRYDEAIVAAREAQRFRDLLRKMGLPADTSK